MKNVELTDRNSEKRVDNSYFIGPSYYGDSIFKGNLTIPTYFAMQKIWSGKSSITIPILSDSFKENKMTKLSKSITKCLIFLA